jgi:DnaK suppressor protein
MTTLYHEVPEAVTNPEASAAMLSSPARAVLPEGYQPSEHEEYMSPQQLAFFRERLTSWREELLEESRRTVEEMRDEVRDVTDEAERASRESEHSLALRTRERYRKLIPKINAALERIEDGSYGYCAETGEPIGVPRLLARPIATLSVEAQERYERMKKQQAEDL